MPNLTSRSVARRLVVPFAISLLTLTTVLIADYVAREVPRLGHQASAGTIATLILLSVPFTVAMTIPMSVFVAVLWAFTRLGTQGAIDMARQERGGLRRLLAPVIGFATGVAALMLMWNAELLPRANARLVGVITTGTAARGDRTMTLGELRAAARDARANATAGTNATSAKQVARYEIEVQKKPALATACLALALAAAAIGLRFPRRGASLVVVMSLVVFGAYYVGITTGETLANRLVVSPLMGMWTPNVLLAMAASLAMWRSGPRGAPRGAAVTSPSPVSEVMPGTTRRISPSRSAEEN